jgi:hypothetical protein
MAFLPELVRVEEEDFVPRSPHRSDRLRARRAAMRPAAEQRDELAPSHA